MSLLAFFFSFSAVTIRSSIVHLRMCFALANVKAVAWYITLVCLRKLAMENAGF